jgi:hypothetical protein
MSYDVADEMGNYPMAATQRQSFERTQRIGDDGGQVDRHCMRDTMIDGEISSSGLEPIGRKAL